MTCQHSLIAWAAIFCLSAGYAHNAPTLAAEEHCATLQAQLFEGVELVLGPATMTTTLGEPVVVVLTIRNRRSESVRVDLGKNDKNGLRFSVRNPLGATSEHRIQEPPEGGIYTPGEETISSGKSYHQELIINEWVRWEQPGQYTICLQVDAPVVTTSGRNLGALGPAALVLQVLPRSEEALSLVCQRLEEAALSSNREAAQRAALALSFVNDPVAVPFLARVALKGGPGAYAAVEGLGRVGGPLATEALVRAFGSLKGFDRLQALAQLSRLRSSVTDAGLLKRIDAALAEGIGVVSESESEEP